MCGAETIKGISAIPIKRVKYKENLADFPSPGSFSIQFLCIGSKLSDFLGSDGS